MNRIKLQFLGTSEFVKHCNSCVYTQLVFSLKCVWKFPDNWRDLPRSSSKLDLCFQKAWFLELVLVLFFFFLTWSKNDGADCTEEAEGVRCFESSGWLFFIYKHRAVFNFISKKKFFFPLLWKWWPHNLWYLLWAMLWGFILWHLLTFLSWGVFCWDPLTACQRSPEDTARDVRGPSLRTEN